MSEIKTWDLFEDGEHAGQCVGTMDQAAAEVVRMIESASRPSESHTVWFDWYVRSEDGAESSGTLAIDPPEPKCSRGRDHDWAQPRALVGGGVQGNGGGVVLRYVCRHCGTYRVTDSWAQRPDTGEQGLTSVEYEDADDESRAWVRGEIVRGLVDALEADDSVTSYDQPDDGADRIDGVELADGIDADAWMARMEEAHPVSAWKSESGAIELTADYA